MNTSRPHSDELGAKLGQIVWRWEYGRAKDYSGQNCPSFRLAMFTHSEYT